MSLVTLLVIILLIAALGGLPPITGHPYGYWPSGGLGLVLIILIVLILAGRL